MGHFRHGEWTHRGAGAVKAAHMSPFTRTNILPERNRPQITFLDSKTEKHGAVWSKSRFEWGEIDFESRKPHTPGAIPDFGQTAPFSTVLESKIVICGRFRPGNSSDGVSDAQGAPWAALVRGACRRCLAFQMKPVRISRRIQHTAACCRLWPRT